MDTEGSELMVLQSINFNITTFDVITVEIEKQFRPVNYLQKITKILDKVDYRLVLLKGRNAWYINKNYKPSKSKTLYPDMSFNTIKPIYNKE